MKNWFVLFVRSGSEFTVAEYLRGKLDAERYTPFVLTKETLFWLKGTPAIVRKPLFDGYVMVETDADAQTVVKDISDWIYMSGGSVYEILSYDDEREEIMLRESERKALESLVGSDFCVAASDGTLENGTLKITSGALKGQEGRIVKILKNKQKAVINMEFAGEIVEMTVVLRVKKAA